MTTNEATTRRLYAVDAAVTIALIVACLAGGYALWYRLPQIKAVLQGAPAAPARTERPPVVNLGGNVGAPANPAAPAPVVAPAGKQMDAGDTPLRDQPAATPVTAPQPEGGKRAEPEGAPQGKVAEPEQSAPPVVEQLSTRPGKRAEGGDGGVGSSIGGGARP